MDRTMRRMSVRWPADVADLKAEIPELRQVSDYEVQGLYEEFSDRLYAAGWIGLGPDTLLEFREWLLAD